MRRKIFSVLLAIMLIAPAAHPASLGIMVAAYFVPGPKWDAMSYAASRVPLIAIMNPNNGPGLSQNANYVNALSKLHQAGGKITGYLYTSYTARSLASVEADIDSYLSWYAVDGFFIDEMTNDANTNHLDYYATLYQYIKAKGAQYSVTGNPGANTQESYVTRPTADSFMIFENNGTNYATYNPPSWVSHYSPDHFVHLPYGVAGTTTLSNYVSLAVSRNAGWVYISDLTVYSALPTYWTNEVDLLQSLNETNPTNTGTFKHITVDGSFDDWSGVPLAYTQARDVTNAVAYQNLYLANDEDYLYVRFSIYGSPTNVFTSLQNYFFNTDNDSATGYNAHGTGSEMLIQSGKGYQETNGNFNAGAISGLNWAASPSGVGSEFEFRVSRNATYASTGNRVFTNDTITLRLESETTGFVSSEWYPPSGGGVAYTFTTASNAIVDQNLVTNFYTSSTEDFPNPERGFYIQADSYASAPSTVPSNLASYRVNGKSSPGNTYTAKISLVLRLFYLDTFVNAPISSNFLNSIQTDFDSIRNQGDKAIVRFAYNKDTTRPFDEPTKARILSHIEQLKPLLQKNSDVIAVLQMGMIAAWGEGYYTDVFYTNGQATAQNWLDRIEVLNAELAALPTERMIQVRVPQFKQKYVYGTDAPPSAAPISPTLAFTGTNIARIGFHNDCYLASSTDYGTFSDNDYGSSTSQQDVTNLRNYLAQETRFAPMGGETCNAYPPTDDCSSVGGNADLDMAFAHYSFLNQGYNSAVNDDWVTQGCMELIKRRLGYRLGLVSGVFRTEAQPGQAIPLALVFTNAGFASLYNPRGLEIILRNTGTGQKFFAALSRDTDPRRWLPGSNYVVNAQLSLPHDIPAGDYEWLLNLPDPAPSLYGNTAYSIHLANSNAVSSTGTVLNDVWESTTGYHRLGRILTINSTATNAAPNGNEIPVLNFSSIAETYDTWKARNFSSNPADGLPDADPDGDSRANLLEYAIGSDPNYYDTSNYLNVFFQGAALFLCIHKGPGVKDVDYEVEASPTLAPATWSTSSVTILENDASTFCVSYSGTAASGFLRLKLSLE